MRTVRGFGLGIVAVVLAGAAPAAAQSGRDLASPRRERARERPAPVASEVQELSVIGPAEAPREYGDGGGAELGWDDPELDLDPRGWVHFVLGARVAYLAGDARYAEAIDAGGVFGLDVCLLPALSLHLRFGLAVGAHGPLGRASPPLGLVFLRPFVLVGMHPIQRFSLRVGAELGPELVQTGFEVGGAALAQLGVRPFGPLEIALELAVDVRPGVDDAIPRRFYTFTTPRVGAVVLVTF